MQSTTNGLALVGDNNYTWFEDGDIKSHTSCVKDTCSATYFYSSGGISKIEKYNKLKGEIIYIEERCENGQVESIIRLGEAQKNFITYHCNGKIRIKSSLNENGALVGQYKLYSEGGVVLAEGNYFNHKGRDLIKEGKWLYYDEKGDLITIETYENGILIEPIK